MSNHLVGAAEAAEILGVSRQRVAQMLAEIPGFPRPEVELAAGRIWKRADIKKWAKENRKEIPMLKCSFCGKGEKEVRRLIFGPGENTNICDQCVEYAYSIVTKDEDWKQDPR
jgi:hypothetical protein